MNKLVLFVAVFLIALALILGGVWFVGQDETSQGTSQELTKTNGDTNSGNVQVDVTLATKDNAAEIDAGDYDLSKEQVFNVAMNTHSVDITGYDMADISFLKTDGKKARASKWDSAEEGGGHHLSGFLVFEKSAEAKELKLIIKGIAGVAEREFSWKL
jgi:hypothetical protein